MIGYTVDELESIREFCEGPEAPSGEPAPAAQQKPLWPYHPAHRTLGQDRRQLLSAHKRPSVNFPGGAAAADMLARESK